MVCPYDFTLHPVAHRQSRSDLYAYQSSERLLIDSDLYAYRSVKHMFIGSYRSALYPDQSSIGVIYSVCFSPDTDYLATADEDRQIRVSYRFFAMFSRLAMTYMPTFLTLQLFLQQLTFHTQ